MSTLKLDNIQHPDAVSAALTFDSDGTMATATGFSSGGLKVKSSGGGTFSINPPSSASDRTLTLPDEAGTVLTSGGSHLMVDTWYLTSDVTHSTATTNIGSDDSTTWTRQTSYGSLGSPMSVSNDDFSFPQTGVYRINFAGNGIADNVDELLRLEGQVDTGSGYVAFVTNTFSHGTSASRNYGNTLNAILAVTNTSTTKLRFRVTGATGSTTYGGQDPMLTYVIFERIGDVS
jgi:hypothetical protein